MISHFQNNLLNSKSSDILDDSPAHQPAAPSNGSLANHASHEAPSAPDPIVGRYRMESSECFDEFMKALGVGMMKRKMANSVTPVNVVEIDPTGEIQGCQLAGH